MVRGGAGAFQLGAGGFWAMIERKLRSQPRGRAGRFFGGYRREAVRLVQGKAGKYFWQARVAATITIKNPTCSGLQ